MLDVGAWSFSRRPPMTAPITKNFRAEKFDFWSFFFTGLTGLATLLILGILATILINIIANGWQGFSWHFDSTISLKDFSSASTPPGCCRLLFAPPSAFW